MEKILANFRISLSRMKDHALLSLLLTNDKIRYLSIEKCHEILAACENRLQNLFSESSVLFGIDSLRREDNIRLLAAQELIRRLQIEEVLEKPKISKSQDIYQLFHHLSEHDFEEFWIVVLNKANRVIGQYKISEGGVSGTVVDIKRIFHLVLNILGTAIILVHNHPSGNINPSENDISITRRIVEAGKLFDVVVLDHIVVGIGYYSFADSGIL
jgi:DNA repair protein RadC